MALDLTVNVKSVDETDSNAPLTTPEGTSLTPLEPEQFPQEADVNIPEFALPPKIGMSVAMSAAGVNDPQDLIDYSAFRQAENDRIDSVLKDRLGSSYKGRDAIGSLSFNVADGIARRQVAGTFQDREAYFKKHHPEGRYFRVPTGGGQFVEMYTIAEGGDIFRVDPDGFYDLANKDGKLGIIFDEVTNELAQGTGTFANMTTAGSLVGTLFSPFIGTAIGASVGNIIDQAIADETSLTPQQAREKLKIGDAATVGLIDGTLTKILPMFGGKLKQLLKGEEGGSILARKTAGEKALAAQTAAQDLGLPLLSVAQLSDNILLSGSFGQAAGTSSIPGKVLNNQSRRLLEALQKKAAVDFDSFTPAELQNYVRLMQAQQSEVVGEVLNKRLGMGAKDTSTEFFEANISKNAQIIKEAHDELIDTAYKKAFALAEAENVVFNLSPVLDVAQSIRRGTQTRVQPKRSSQGQFTKTETVRAEGELSGDALNIVNQLTNVINPKISKLVVRDQGKEFSFDALSQIKGIRDRASQMVKDDSTGQMAQLVKAIDEAIANPVGGGQQWKTAWQEAKDLVKLRNDVQNASNIASLFSRKSQVMPDNLAEKFWTGEFGAKDWDYLERMLKTASAGNGNATIAKNALLDDIRDGMLSWVYQNPELAGQRLATLKNAPDGLWNKIVPKAEDRAALEKVIQESTWLQSDGVQKAISRRFTNAERALASIDEMTEAEIISFINKNGGLQGELAEDMRAAVFKRLLDGNTTIDEFGLTVANAKPLAEQLTNLTNFSGQYAKFRPLFQSSKMQGDNVVYEETVTPYLKNIRDFQKYAAVLGGYSPDVGGPMQAGSVRAGLARLDLKAYRTVLTNDLLARVFAQPPSVAQLEKLYGNKGGFEKFWNKRSADVITNLLQNAASAYNSEIESAIDEVKRTGEAPDMGDIPQKVSQAPAMPTPDRETASLDIPSLPLASTPPSAGTSSTNFQSLFPQDELGGAIANRKQGIMGLA